MRSVKQTTEYRKSTHFEQQTALQTTLIRRRNDIRSMCSIRMVIMRHRIIQLYVLKNLRAATVSDVILISARIQVHSAKHTTHITKAGIENVSMHEFSIKT